MRMRLVIDVDYDEATITAEEAKCLLENAAEHLANVGLLSGGGDAVVDDWRYRVEAPE